VPEDRDVSYLEFVTYKGDESMGNYIDISQIFSSCKITFDRNIMEKDSLV
jgi:hypothetical protein